MEKQTSEPLLEPPKVKEEHKDKAEVVEEEAVDPLLTKLKSQSEVNGLYLLVRNLSLTL